MYIITDIFNEQEGLVQDYIETKGNFQIGFIGIIPEISINVVICETDFPNYLLLVGAYSIIPKIYGLEIIITAIVLDYLYMFQVRCGKIDEFGWWE